MKLLLDQGLPRTTVKHLAAAGILSEHVGDLGMSRAADEVILEAARQHDAVIVTLDADFHQSLATSHATAPSVVRIRIEGLKGAQLAAVLAQVIATTSAELASGAVVSVTPSRIRIRALPIRK
jgi:predicted nuclease of predicted toxin-antitoxin system